MWSKLATSRTRLHSSATVCLLTWCRSLTQTASSFLSKNKNKKTPSFCFIIHNFTWGASFPHLTLVWLGIRPVWGWHRNHLVCSFSPTNYERSKIIRETVYIYCSLTKAQLLLVWSTFQRSTTSSENSPDLWSWESNFISSRVLPTV